jgi:hypothetical protein
MLKQAPPGRAAARLCVSRLKPSLLLAAAFVSVGAVSFNPAASGADGSISVPWRAGNAAMFQTGMPEERGAQAAQGALPVRVYRPAGAGPFPFVVLLHGCGGLQHEAMWRSWAEPWAEVFRERGIGTAVVDSFTSARRRPGVHRQPRRMGGAARG